jgi:hypothetical protein
MGKLDDEQRKWLMDLGVIADGDTTLSNAQAQAPGLAADTKKLLAGFLRDIQSLVADQHPDGDKLRKLAIAAGNDAKAGLWEEVKKKVAVGKKAFEQAIKPVKDAKKVANADFGSDTPTDSTVDPGPAEQSLREFADEVKSTTEMLKKAQQLLSKLEGESDTARAIGNTADALGKVTEGLDKAGKGASKLLASAATARKLEECRQVLARVQDVDFMQTDNRVENAKAMGDLAKLIGEFGAKATEEIPALKGYFQLISRAGEIWVPIARMTNRRETEFADAADDRQRPQAPAQAKPIAADTSRTITFEGIPAFLEEQLAIFDRSGQPYEARRARDICEKANFDEHHDKLKGLIEKSQGLKAKVLHELAQRTSIVLPGEEYLQRDLARHWQTCHDTITALCHEFKNWESLGVSFEPALLALDKLRSPSG